MDLHFKIIIIFHLYALLSAWALLGSQGHTGQQLRLQEGEVGCTHSGDLDLYCSPPHKSISTLNDPRSHIHSLHLLFGGVFKFHDCCFQ